MPVGILGGNNQQVNRLYNEPGIGVAAGLAEGLPLLAAGALLPGSNPLTDAIRRAVNVGHAMDQQMGVAAQANAPALVSPVGTSDP